MKFNGRRTASNRFRTIQTERGTGPQPGNRTLFVGKDNYDILCGMDSGTVDIVAMDPPFNKDAPFIGQVKDPELNRRLETLHAGARGMPGSDGKQLIRFNDSWSWDTDWHADWLERLGTDRQFVAVRNVILTAQYSHGEAMAAYITFMAARCIELRRILKKDGAIFLHCDHTACHYVRAMMDAIFGARLFQSQIVWKRTAAHSNSATFGNVYDLIMFYGQRKINVDAIRTPIDPKYLSAKYRHDDGDGRGVFRLDNLKAPDPNSGYSYDFHGHQGPWRHPKAKMEALEADGRIVTKDNGRVPELKRYLSENKGRVLDNLWTDIPPLNSQAAERTGWPTQKPLALYERIIKAIARPGDMVLDPFCGCATTCIATELVASKTSTDLRWVGIEIARDAEIFLDYRMEKEVNSTTPADRTRGWTSGVLTDANGKHIHGFQDKLTIRNYHADGQAAIPARTDDQAYGEPCSPPDDGILPGLLANLLPSTFNDFPQSTQPCSSTADQGEDFDGLLKHCHVLDEQHAVLRRPWVDHADRDCHAGSAEVDECAGNRQRTARFVDSWHPEDEHVAFMADQAEGHANVGCPVMSEPPTNTPACEPEYVTSGGS